MQTRSLRLSRYANGALFDEHFPHITCNRTISRYKCIVCQCSRHCCKYQLLASATHSMKTSVFYQHFSLIFFRKFTSVAQLNIVTPQPPSHEDVPDNFSTPVCRVLFWEPYRSLSPAGSKYLPSTAQQATRPTPRRGPPIPQHTGNPKPQMSASRAQSHNSAKLTSSSIFHKRIIVQYHDKLASIRCPALVKLRY